MAELKPCPFCGKPATMQVVPHIPVGLDFTPRCTDTACAGRLAKKFPSKEIAIYRWNRRVKDGK